jgi:hypothetical protein
VLTTATTLGTGILIIGIFSYIAGAVTFAIRGINIAQSTYLNIVGYATVSAMAVAFISFALAFIFAGTKHKSLYLVVPIVMLFLSLFYSMAEWLEWVRWISPFGWVDYSVMAGGSYEWWQILLVYSGCVAIIISAIILTAKLFKKRNLSI